MFTFGLRGGRTKHLYVSGREHVSERLTKLGIPNRAERIAGAMPCRRRMLPTVLVGNRKAEIGNRADNPVVTL